MALVAVEGFDLYNGVAANSLTAPSMQMNWTIGSSSGCSLVAGRFAGQAFHITNSQNTRALKNNYTSGFAVGMAIRVPVLPGSIPISGNIGFLSSTGGFQFSLRVNTVGGIDVVRWTNTSSGTIIGSSSGGVLVAGTWYYLEMEADLSTTTGRVTVYLNGTQIINLTGINNLNSGAGTNVGIIMLYANNGTNSMTMEIDDFYEADASTKIGEGKVETCRASADTATKTWTPSSGTNNAAMVSETLADGDTTYVQASTVGNQDLYDLVDLGSTPATIYGVQITMIGRKTDAGSRSIALTAKSGVTGSQGPDYSLAATYVKMDRMLTQDPNTSANWTAAGVNALQAGPKVTV